MMRTALIITCALGLTACGEAWQDNRMPFGGIYWSSSLDVAKETPEDFSIVVKDATQDRDAAKEAGRFEGIKYCVEFFGSSDIDWGQGPDQRLNIVKGDLYLNGSCTG